LALRKSPRNPARALDRLAHASGVAAPRKNLGELHQGAVVQLRSASAVVASLQAWLRFSSLISGSCYAKNVLGRARCCVPGLASRL
jgi:hypothetical protein